MSEPDREMIIRSAVAAPLRERCADAGDAEQLEVVIDLNMRYTEGPRGGRDRVERLLAETSGTPTAERAEVRPLDISSHCLAARLTPAVILEVAGRKEHQAIHRIWPDFRVRPLMDASVATVKADAARQSFNASGKGTLWAVLDSGIDGEQRHFRMYKNLRSRDVEALIGIAGVVLGAVAGTIATYLTTRSRMRWELVYAYDRELRDKRLPHYQKLFHITRALPREWRPDAVPSRDDLWRTREEFHDWFFAADAGGMFLTQPARDLYFGLQNGLEKAAARPDLSPGGGEAPLTKGEQEMLYELASALRHQLSADVGTAQSSRLDWTGHDPARRWPRHHGRSPRRAQEADRAGVPRRSLPIGGRSSRRVGPGQNFVRGIDLLVGCDSAMVGHGAGSRVSDGSRPARGDALQNHGDDHDLGRTLGRRRISRVRATTSGLKQPAGRSDRMEGPWVIQPLSWVRCGASRSGGGRRRSMSFRSTKTGSAPAHRRWPTFWTD